MVFNGLEKSWVEYAIEDKLKEIKFWEVRDEKEKVVYSGQRYECVVYKRVLEYEDVVNDGIYE